MQQNDSINSDDRDLFDFAEFAWLKRRVILKLTFISFLLGLVIALTGRVEFEAACKLMPESQEGIKGSLGGLSGLAGLAGIDLGSGAQGTLTPALYPEIVKSVPFQLELIHRPIQFGLSGAPMSSYTYFKEVDSKSWVEIFFDYTVGLPGKIKKWISPSSDENLQLEGNLIHITKEDWELLEDYMDRISVSVNDETGIITVQAEMPDPYGAARTADLVVKLLTDEVTEYKIEKAKVNLEFIQQRYQEAKQEYAEKQAQLANFTDRNKNITSSLVQVEYQRLQNELNISFEVYKGLATQLEQAKIKVKEETPVFTVLEPVKIPVEKSKPQRTLIIVGFIVLGIIIGILYSLVKFLSMSRNAN